jgi:glyoxylase-like metal-dependent hydrolase (beta-lactamase superfamily II)
MSLVHPWSHAPAPGAAVLVAPGVHWVRLPLPFQLDHVNVWLLEDDAGWTVVDTGLGLPDSRALWEQVLARVDGGRPVQRVVVTHFHPDHLGNAGWLAARDGVEVWCTRTEWLVAQVAWRVRPGPELEARLEHFRRHGAEPGDLERLRRRGNPYPLSVPTLPSAFRRLREGDTLAVGGRRWQVLTAEGHSPEHACLWAPDPGVLLAGDQILPRITTNVSVWPDEPWGNPLRSYLESLGRFEALPADTLVCPAHGLPFYGLRERVAALRAHHAARLHETLTALTAPRSAAEVARVLFPQELDGHQLGFALGEALAHLVWLEAEGRARRVVGEDGVHRFVSA